MELEVRVSGTREEIGHAFVDIGQAQNGSLPQSEADKLFSFDGIHPNNAGHARIAEAFWPAIREALGERGPLRSGDPPSPAP